MKKIYFRFLSFMLCALFCSSVFAERLAYGFVVNDMYESGDKYLCSFNPNQVGDGVTRIQDYQGFKPLAATYAEDTYYLIGQDAARKAYLQKVDLSGNKDYEKIGEALSVTTFADMAYDVNTKTMYAIAPSFNSSDLYTIDLTTAVLSKKATLNNKYHSMTCSPEGQLYGITWLGKFIKIDLNGDTAAETPIKDVLIALDEGTVNQSLDFDTEANVLYWIYTDALSYDSFLYKIDPATGDISDMKQFPNGEEIIGLCFADDGNQEPGPPTPPEGAREAFGFSLSTASDKPTPFGVQTVEFRTFNANAVQEGTTFVKEYGLLNAPQAAAYVNTKDSIYLIGQNADGMYLYRMDKGGENYAIVGTEQAKLENVIFKDMAYDALNDVLYAVADSSKEEKVTKHVLYTFNLTTGATTTMITPDSYLALAVLKSGQLMGITAEGLFGALYPKSGQIQKVDSIDTDLFKTTDISVPMDMEFDLSTLTLYWSYTDKEGKGHMAIIDPATGKASNENAFKDGEQVIGLYFPTKEVEPSATWYAFSMFSNTHDEDNGFVTFDPANLTSVMPIGTFNTDGVAAGAGANGIYYAARTAPNGYGAKATNLATVNLEDGTMTNIAPMESTLLLWDMTYDYSTNTMYGISMEGDPDPSFVGSLINTYCRLFAMDMTTYEWKAIARLDTEYRGIACSLDGQLYAFTQKGSLRKLNKLTGAYEIVMETGITVEPTFPASMEFDHANEALYCTYFTEATTTGKKREPSKAAMSQFDYVAKKVVDTKVFPGRDKLCGLYIPFEWSATSPAKVTDLAVSPGAEGALEATITWKNPSKTHGGEDLTTITKVEILRDGTVINTLTEAQTPGKANTYTDQQVTLGFHTYVVRTYNGEEVSEPAAVFKFIGEDVPAAPANVVLTVGEGSKATITWEAPTTGLNTGWFNTDKLTYTIVRQPDNKTLKLDYTGTTLEDEVPMMNYYTYEVTAYSTKGKGGTGVSNSATVGTAFVPPYSCDFMNDAEAGLWTLTGTWKIDNFGMGENYQGLVHGWEEKCNSWAYSPLIKFRNDKSYLLTFKARSAVLGPKTLERVRITAGLDKTAEAQTVAIAEVDSIGGGNSNLVLYSVNFNMPASNDYYLGFYCTSVDIINDDGDYERTYSDLQITNISLYELPYNPIAIDSNEVMNDVFVYAQDGKIRIAGEYTSAMVYNQLGAVCPMDATLAKGIYIVKVMNGNTAKTYKVLVK